MPGIKKNNTQRATKSPFAPKGLPSPKGPLWHDPSRRRGSSGFLPPWQEPLARQQVERCRSHLLCWWQGDSQNGMPPSPTACCPAPPHPSCPARGAAARVRAYRWHPFSSKKDRGDNRTQRHGAVLTWRPYAIAASLPGICLSRDVFIGRLTLSTTERGLLTPLEDKAEDESFNLVSTTTSLRTRGVFF